MTAMLEAFRDRVSQPSRRVRLLAVMEYLAEEGPTWKKRIHDEAGLGVSVQTIGRDVDVLLDEGLVQSEPMTSEEAYRTVVIGFDLSDEGREFVESHRVCTLCEDVVRAGHSHSYEVLPASDYLGGER